MTDDRIAQARLLAGNYVEPYLGLPLGEAKAVKSVRLDGARTIVELELGFPLGHYAAQLAGAVRDVLRKSPELADAEVTVAWQVSAQPVQGALAPLPGIRNVIAVASGKGGVGKSTTAANLAAALAFDGARVGLLDADIYGPSQPRMMGLAGERPTTRDGQRMRPLEAHGVRVMSIGFLIEEEQPMVWRGPMVTQALNQLLGQTEWGELDYLVVDMPPGTGDAQLSMAQLIPITGAVMVTTPQEVSIIDVEKAIAMWRRVEVPVVGVVENMSGYVCTSCGHHDDIFSRGGGKTLAEREKVAFLGEVPINASIRGGGDAGKPIVLAAPDSPVSKVFREIARNVACALSVRNGPARKGGKLPLIR